jgi:hypothetical protein
MSMVNQLFASRGAGMLAGRVDPAKLASGKRQREQAPPTCPSGERLRVKVTGRGNGGMKQMVSAGCSMVVEGEATASCGVDVTDRASVATALATNTNWEIVLVTTAQG